MDEDAEFVYEYMVAWDYWPEIVTKGEELNNIFFVSNRGNIIQSLWKLGIVIDLYHYLLMGHSGF